MNQAENIVLKRNCPAIQIPSGEKIELFEGTHLRILQSLGGTYTVMTDQGAMASIAGKDADAIGKEAVQPPSQQTAEGTPKTVEEMIWDQLRTCYDPEIPHNIVDLGLIYECKLTPVEDGKTKVGIKMTLTAPGCGMGEWLKKDAAAKIMNLPGIAGVEIDVVFDPPWDPSKMSKALRRALNMM